MRNFKIINRAKANSIIFSVALLVFAFRTEAQIEETNTTNIGVEFGTSVSGNGHGMIYTPQLALSNDKHTVLLGSCLQQQALKFNGARLAYSFNLSKASKQIGVEEDEEDSTEMVYQYFQGNETTQDVNSEPAREQRVSFKMYVYAEYLKDNLLSRSTQKMEAHVNRVEGHNWKTVSLSTIEGGLGFEIGVRITKKIHMNTFIAASLYYHTKYIENMHHERFSPTITLGTSISIPRIS